MQRIHKLNLPNYNIGCKNVFTVSHSFSTNGHISYQNCNVIIIPHAISSEYLSALLLLTVQATVENGTCTRYGFDVEFPGVSCADIHNKNPASHGKSGYYVIKADHVHTVYSDMELQSSGYKGGWMKIADYDTKTDECPSGWKKTKVNSLDLCQSPNNNAGCHSYVNKVKYNKICSKVRGYQKGLPSTFAEVSNPSLNNGYIC